jgi:putative ABC transport system permease protein
VLGLVIGALRARRVQALVMLALAALTVLAAGLAARVAGPAGRDAAQARVDAATLAERTLRVRGPVAAGDRPEDVLRRIQALVRAPLDERAGGLRLPGSLAAGERRQAAELRSADGLCAALALRQGRCPAEDGEVVLDEELARQLGIGVGAQLRHEAGLTTTAVPLRVVGIYAPADSGGWFWAGQAGAAAYTTAPTVTAAGATVHVTFDALLSTDAFEDPDGLRTALERLRGAQFEATSGAPALAARVAADRRAVGRGLALDQAQILLFGGLAIAVAAAYAAQERRGDAARLALRGLPRWRIRATTAGQSLLPLAVGSAWSPRLFAAGAVIVVAADWSATRGGVAELMRDVRPRRPLVAATAEVCALGLAVAALFQILAAPAADVRRDAGFGLAQLAPLLVAAGLGVLGTRLLLAAAGLYGRAALAAGRLTRALAGLTLGRRRTAYRIIPVFAAATCVLALAAQDWQGGSAARAGRAGVELGADRVLRVGPVGRERLLAAVRAADPGGRAAMAVVVTGGAAGASGPTVVAADAARLRAVTGVDGAPLRPPAPAAPAFAGTGLELTASGEGARVRLRLIADGTGEPAVAEFGPLTGDAARHAAVVPACARGCRLAAVEADTGPAGGPVELREVTAGGTVVVPGAVLADATRWRTTIARAGSGVQARHGDGRLRLTAVAARAGWPVDDRLYVVDAPVPLPALVAGDPLGEDNHDQPTASVFGVTVPLDPRPAALVPRGGGAGVLVDLEYAGRIAAAARGAVPAPEQAEVWLAPGAGDAVVARLRAAGLEIAGSDSIAAATGRAERLAPAVSLLGDLAAAGVVLLLAAVAGFVVAAVDRRDRDAELTALRRQGVPARAVRRVERRAALAPVLVGVAVGLAAAVLLRLLVPPPVRAFADAWPVPVPPVQPLALLAAGAAALLVFGAVALVRPGRRP